MIETAYCGLCGLLNGVIFLSEELKWPVSLLRRYLFYLKIRGPAHNPLSYFYFFLFNFNQLSHDCQYATPEPET